MAEFTRSRLQRLLDSQLFETVLALAFTAGCVALVYGFTQLVRGDSLLGWLVRGARALWRLLFVCVLAVGAVGAVDAHAQNRVLRGDSDRVDIVTPHGMWTGVGEAPRKGNEIKGNFITPDGNLRHPLASLAAGASQHCILHTDRQGSVMFKECP